MSSNTDAEIQLLQSIKEKAAAAGTQNSAASTSGSSSDSKITRESSAFSRREITNDVPIVSSAYSEVKEAPAWVKKDTPVDKYDKYGSRPAVSTSSGPSRVSRPESESTDNKYSKYISRAAEPSTRVKRSREEFEREEPDPREYGNSRIEQEKDDDGGAAIPYSNLDVSNQSYDHRTLQSREYYTFQSHISNKEERDINSIVRTHYNQRAVHSKRQVRKNSPIIKMRNFNNAIKYMLLGNYSKREQGVDRPFTFLDLCCGKGGDLNKCQFLEIDQYIGIDISDVSVKEASFPEILTKEGKIQVGVRTETQKR